MTTLGRDIDALLNCNSAGNISFIGFFSTHNAIEVKPVNSSVFASGVSDELWWYSAANNIADFKQFLKELKGRIAYLAVLTNEQLAAVKEHYSFEWTLSCMRYILPSNVSISNIQENINPSKLKVTDANTVYLNSNYNTYTNPVYIAGQIANGPSVGVRSNGKLVGWALTHDDTALGMLHVMDDYRRKGIARALVTSLIGQIREKGCVPFTYVEHSNEASNTLVRSLGFVPDRNVHWVKVNLK
ncbi:MAG: GNAT family N-acetyltransferase [Bacteroidales bacterium]|nr:GNAT family N-acetyltransferase [Bacteroidales bacterium]MBN2750692.1 GNAT family N-acetyltransferase [Bacteroidales bacterium]